VTASSLGRRVHFAARPPLVYDALSLGVGCAAACPANAAASDSSLSLRPLGTLLRKLDRSKDDLKRSARPFHLLWSAGPAAAAGAGHSQAVNRHCCFQVTLLQGNARLLPEFPESVAVPSRRRFRKGSSNSG